MIELPGVNQQQLVVDVVAGGQPSLEAASTFVTMPIYLIGSAHHVSNHQRPKRWVNYPLADIVLAGTSKFKADVQVTYTITKVCSI